MFAEYRSVSEIGITLKDFVFDPDYRGMPFWGAESPNFGFVLILVVGGSRMITILFYGE
ncbi:MAG: hypothetical protein CM1200mP18_16520 [Gammaproteobacteria bacterium]|nr:MAG: hypothetical protein CM1200mP18_16520 [Gammaproteobacteria bacterium]